MESSTCVYDLVRRAAALFARRQGGNVPPCIPFTQGRSSAQKGLARPASRAHLPASIERPATWSRLVHLGPAPSQCHRPLCRSRELVWLGIFCAGWGGAILGITTFSNSSGCAALAWFSMARRAPPYLWGALVARKIINYKKTTSLTSLSSLAPSPYAPSSFFRLSPKDSTNAEMVVACKEKGRAVSR